MKEPVFRGACTALITPFTESGIDYDRLGRNLEQQYENGSAAVLICGTTGENATLTQEEYDTLLRFTVNSCGQRMKVIAGIGSNNTAHALQNARTAKAVGADAVLMVTPYYNKSTQKGMIEHFRAVADQVDLPMILYNVPSRTGIGLLPETYAELSKHPNINGVKEASGKLSDAAKTTALCGSELNLWSGNDEDTIPMMALGAQGVISVAGNIVPAVIAKLCELCFNASFLEAAALYRRYAALFSVLFVETNPIPVKSAMKLLGQDSGLMRLPLTEPSAEHLGQIRSVLRDLGMSV